MPRLSSPPVKNKQLHRDFKAAVTTAAETKKQLAPDVLLLLYAYYKQATDSDQPISIHTVAENDLRTAFKYNAILQVRGLDKEEAMQEYIRIVNKFIVGNG